jgi:hypothetical protein
MIAVALNKLHARNWLRSVRALQRLKNRPLALVAGTLTAIDRTQAADAKCRSDDPAEAHDGDRQQQNARSRCHWGFSI